MYFTNRIHKNSFTYIYFRIYDIAWRSNQWTIVINWERYHITSYIHSVFIHMPYIYSSIMRCDFYWYLQKDKNANIKNFFQSNSSMNQRLIEDMFELCIIVLDRLYVIRNFWLKFKWIVFYVLSHQLNKDYVLGDELRGSKINVMS